MKQYSGWVLSFHLDCCDPFWKDCCWLGGAGSVLTDQRGLPLPLSGLDVKGKERQLQQTRWRHPHTCSLWWKCYRPQVRLLHFTVRVSGAKRSWPHSQVPHNTFLKMTLSNITMDFPVCCNCFGWKCMLTLMSPALTTPTVECTENGWAAVQFILLTVGKYHKK